MFRWSRRGPEARRVQWKQGGGWLLHRAGGIVGRTWFLETLLPSGRKHRAPGYERALAHFSRTIHFSAEAARTFLMRKHTLSPLLHFLSSSSFSTCFTTKKIEDKISHKSNEQISHFLKIINFEIVSIHFPRISFLLYKIKYRFNKCSVSSLRKDSLNCTRA